MKIGKHLLLMVLLFSIVLYTSAAADQDDILLSNVPIAYGDAQFRQRILDRTQGKRSPVGLVLSGGSARAFAHIGVLKYLEEQGIVPDFIISNSMGSIVGLMYAAGMSPDQILESITSVSLQSLFDLTLPLEGGVLDSSRFIAKLASILGTDLTLEHLPIPIIVVSEDLVTKRQIQISEGDFSTVLRASYALPVYFNPVPYRGHLLIDGGITNLAPIELAYQYADDVIVSTTFYDVDTLNLKNPLTILNVSIDIGKRRKGVEELKKFLDQIIWVRCGVEDVSFMEFSKAAYLSQKGYESAKTQAQALSALPKTGQSIDLSGLRTALETKLQESTDQYRLFDHVPVHIPSQLLGLGLDSDYAVADTTPLKDDTTLGLKYLYRSGDFSARVNAGSSFQFLSNDQFSMAPAVRAQADYYLFKQVKASAFTSFLFDLTGNAPLLSFGGQLEGRLYLLDDRLRLSLVQSFEQLSNFKDSTHLGVWNGNTFFSTTEVQALASFAENPIWQLGDTSLSLSYQILGDYQLNRTFVSARFGTEGTYKAWDLFGTMKGFARFTLDGKGEVPFFFSDGFRTTNATIKNQGHDLSVFTNPANQLVGLQLSIGYRPRNFAPALAELFLIKHSSIAVYSDLLWMNQNFTPYLSLGLELHTEISLLGIRTLPLTIYGGWDQSVNNLVWGFWFNIVY
ncbi:MAG: patatin-like phospholipase family protein [Sphaerochaeta sp.]|uniref:patatin-like phospholipase family protein n=1 Tax=Sphaerochaeta sp. TaxID=1972642 RepID=UPI003D10D2BE